MTDEELHHVIRELADRVGRPFTGAWQPRRDRVVLGIRDETVLIVPRGPFARLHTVKGRGRNPDRPYSFQGALRAWLQGPLTAIEMHPTDRVVDLVFGANRLHLRLTGRSGGLWLMDPERAIAAFDGPAPKALPELPQNGGAKRSARFQPRPGESWNEAAEAWFTVREADRGKTDRRQAVGSGIRKRIDRAERLAEGLDADLRGAAEAPRIRRAADALAAALHTIKKGASLVDLPDLEDPAVVHRVELDPERSAAHTMDRMYGKARRLDRAGDRVIERIDAVETELRMLRAALIEVETADAEALDRLAKLVPAVQGRAKEAAEQLPYVTWTGPKGEEVLVGRNAAANRKLTFQVARGEDWWLHIRGRPGAHVVLRMPMRRDPTIEALLAAAQITAIHAKVEEGTAVDVQYTRVKNVKSIKGGGPGEVTVHEEKVLHVQRESGGPKGWTKG